MPTNLLTWSQVTHTPASIKSGGAYKPKKSALYSTFARQLWWHLSSRMALCLFSTLTFKPTQASFAHINSQPSHSTSYKIFFFFFLSVGGFLQSSAQPHESVARQLQRTTGHIKRICPPCWFRLDLSNDKGVSSCWTWQNHYRGCIKSMVVISPLVMAIWLVQCIKFSFMFIGGSGDAQIDSCPYPTLSHKKKWSGEPNQLLQPV